MCACVCVRACVCVIIIIILSLSLPPYEYDTFDSHQSCHVQNFTSFSQFTSGSQSFLFSTAPISNAVLKAEVEKLLKMMLGFGG